MKTTLGHVAYTKLGLEKKTSLFHFCKNFNIDISSNLDSRTDCLTPNFVYFLLENKTFILMYELDYYSNKSIEIIANKIGRQKHEIDKYFQNHTPKIDHKYPYRYISSYKINYDLGGKCNFLKYDKNKLYQGNFQYRRELNEK